MKALFFCRLGPSNVRGARCVIGALLGLLSSSIAAAAEPPLVPPVPKLLVLVRAQECDRPALRAALDSIGKALVGRSDTRQVVLDLGLENLEAPSPFAALVEVEADPTDFPPLAELVQGALPKHCASEIYRSDARVMRSYERDWAIGSPSPGIKLISTVIRQPAFPADEFVGYWAGPHAKIAMSNPARIWQYTQLYVSSALSSTSRPIDGVAMLHYKDPSLLQMRWVLAPEASLRGYLDGNSFMDLRRGESFVAQEIVLKQGLP